MTPAAFACERCGEAVPGGAVFCALCGAPVVRRAEPPAPAPAPLDVVGVAFGRRVEPLALPGPAASPTRRCIAVAVDAVGAAALAVWPVWVVVTRASELVGWAARGRALWGPVAVAAGAWLGVWVAAALTGLTPGRLVTGLRLVRLANGARPGFGRTLGRSLLAYFGNAFLVGWVIALVGVLRDKIAHRSWYDKASGLVLVRRLRGAPVSANTADAAAPVGAKTPGAGAPAPGAGLRPLTSPPPTYLTAGGSFGAGWVTPPPGGVPGASGAAAPGVLPGGVPGASGAAAPAGLVSPPPQPPPAPAPGAGARWGSGGYATAAPGPAAPAGGFITNAPRPAGPAPVIAPPPGWRAPPGRSSGPASGFSPTPAFGPASASGTALGPRPASAFGTASGSAPAFGPASASGAALGPPPASGTGQAFAPAAFAAGAPAYPGGDGLAGWEAGGQEAASYNGGGGLLLEFDTGEAIEVAGAGLVGRDPDGAGAPPGNGDTAFVHLIAVEDPARSVSKTHLEFWREGSGLAVRDRHSTNGSKIERADGSTADLPGGQAEIVRLGEAVLFGARRFNVRGG